MGTTSVKYKIEKNIPLVHGLLLKCEYPFDKMEVKDSFFIKLEGQSDKQKENLGVKVCSTGRKRSHHQDRKKVRRYAYRIYPNGIRIWRTK